MPTEQETFQVKANSFLRLKGLRKERDSELTRAQRNFETTSNELAQATKDLHACLGVDKNPRMFTSTEHKCTVMLDYVREAYGDAPGNGHSAIRIFDEKGSEIP